MSDQPAERRPRVAVLVPCFNDGDHVEETIESLADDEPFELVVIDDASTDAGTHAALRRLEQHGVRVIRQAGNGGVGAARTAGLRVTSAPFVFPLDSDDLAVPGSIGRLAELLEAAPGAVVAYGDYEEFGEVQLVRQVPERIDPYRLAYTNEYPQSAVWRRSFLERVGGWGQHRIVGGYYEDWALWMSAAQLGLEGVYGGEGFVSYRQRVHGPRLLEHAKRNHVAIYRYLRDTHQGLFERLPEHRRASDLSRRRKLLYPIVYGRRPRLPFEARVKRELDRRGVWTLRR